jgi:quinol monooxygenase YgiN
MEAGNELHGVRHRKGEPMVKLGIAVRLEAKPGKEEEVAAFLSGALSLVEEEPQTVTWFAIRFSKSRFGIFDAFADETGRQEHLNGKVAAALMAKAPELFAGSVNIEKAEILASKLPE